MTGAEGDLTDGYDTETRRSHLCDAGRVLPVLQSRDGARARAPRGLGPALAAVRGAGAQPQPARRRAPPADAGPSRESCPAGVGAGWPLSGLGARGGEPVVLRGNRG